MSLDKSKYNPLLDYTLFPREGDHKGNSFNTTSKPYEFAANNVNLVKGSMNLRRFEKQDDLNLSSSTTVAGNYLRYFGNQVDASDLPSPIENVLVNPLDNQLSSLYTSEAAGSSGYVSACFNSNEYSKDEHKYASKPNIPLDIDKYNKIRLDSGIGSTATAKTNAFNNPKIIHFEPVAGPSTAPQRWVCHQLQYPENNLSGFEKDAKLSSRPSDIFSNASDSPFLAPEPTFDNTRFMRSHDECVEVARHSSASILRDSFTNLNFVDPNRKHIQGMLKQTSELQRPLNIFGTRSGTRARNQVICKFCFTNKEPHEECKHPLKDELGLITCPVLYTYICDICGATGPYAHTRKHCPKKGEVYPAPLKNDKPSFKKWRNGIVTFEEESK